MRVSSLGRRLDEWVADNRICKDRILGAVSSDGLRWRRLEEPCINVGRASPFDDTMVYGCHVARVAPNLLRMYYQSSRFMDDRWRSRILRAHSEDGIAWSGPAETGIAAGAHQLCALRVQSPHVVAVGGRWLMYFAGSDVSATSRILLAESRDGLVWQIIDKAILSPSDYNWHFNSRCKGLSDPSIVQVEGGRLRMFASISLDDGFRQEIVSATSSDGFDWFPDEGFRIDGREQGLREVVNNPSVIGRPGHYRMWFRATDILPLESHIYEATSHDSLIWKVQRPSLRYSRWNRYERHGVGFPFVFEDSGIYRMFYTGYWGGWFCGDTVRMYRDLHRKRSLTVGVEPLSS